MGSAFIKSTPHCYILFTLTVFKSYYAVEGVFVFCITAEVAESYKLELITWL